MKVGMTTATATSHGLIARRSMARGIEAAVMAGSPSWPGLRLGCWGDQRRHEVRLEDLPGIGALRGLVHMHMRRDRQSDEQRRFLGVVLHEIDSHRQALHNLHEISRGVFGR